mgnify:CR=1 FL=1|jgi:hypothetical protein
MKKHTSRKLRQMGKEWFEQRLQRRKVLSDIIEHLNSIKPAKRPKSKCQ